MHTGVWFRHAYAFRSFRQKLLLIRQYLQSIMADLSKNGIYTSPSRAEGSNRLLNLPLALITTPWSRH